MEGRHRGNEEGAWSRSKYLAAGADRQPSPQLGWQWAALIAGERQQFCTAVLVKGQPEEAMQPRHMLPLHAQSPSYPHGHGPRPRDPSHPCLHSAELTLCRALAPLHSQTSYTHSQVWNCLYRPHTALCPPPWITGQLPGPPHSQIPGQVVFSPLGLAGQSLPLPFDHTPQGPGCPLVSPLPYTPWGSMHRVGRKVTDCLVTTSPFLTLRSARTVRGVVWKQADSADNGARVTKSSRPDFKGSAPTSGARVSKQLSSH